MTARSTISIDLSPAVKGINEAANAINRLGAQWAAGMGKASQSVTQAVTEAAKASTKQLSEIGVAFEATGKKADAASKGTANLAKGLKAVGQGAGQAAIQFDNAGRKVDALMSKLERLDRVARRFRRGFEQRDTPVGFGDVFELPASSVHQALPAPGSQRAAHGKGGTRGGYVPEAATSLNMDDPNAVKWHRASLGRGPSGRPLTPGQLAEYKAHLASGKAAATPVTPVTAAEQYKAAVAGMQKSLRWSNVPKGWEGGPLAQAGGPKLSVPDWGPRLIGHTPPPPPAFYSGQGFTMRSKPRDPGWMSWGRYPRMAPAQGSQRPGGWLNWGGGQVAPGLIDPHVSRHSMTQALLAQGMSKTQAGGFFDKMLAQRSGVMGSTKSGALGQSPPWVGGDQHAFLNKSFDTVTQQAKDVGVSFVKAVNLVVESRNREIAAIYKTQDATEKAAKAAERTADKEAKAAKRKADNDAKADKQRADRDARESRRIAKERARDMARDAADRQSRNAAWTRGVAGRNPFPSNWFAGPMGGAITRVGGLVPSSSAAFVARHSITGMLAGHAIGGNMQRGVGALGGMLGQGAVKLGGAIAGSEFKGAGAIGGMVGGVGGPLLAGVGQAMGTMMNAMVTWQFAKISAAVLSGARLIHAAFSGVSAALALVKNAFMGVGRFLLSWGMRGIAGAGVAGIAAITHGVRSFATEEKALTGMRVIARGAAPGMEDLVAKLGKNSVFSKSDLIEGVKQGLAFGLSPQQITKFLPKMMNSAALFGEDIGQGLRALSRAAFQSEPEAAERYGLNLYEKNLKQLFGDMYDLSDPAQKVAATLMAADMQLQKFNGGMEQALKTVSGTFLFLKSKVNDTFVNLGKGFTGGFDLVGRTRSLAEKFGTDQTQGMAYGIGNAVGGWFGKGSDYLAGMMPSSMDDVSAFFSKDKEKNIWSERGDAMKVFAANAVAMFQVVADQIKEAFAFLSDPAGSMLSGLTSALDTFVSTGWKDSATQMVDILIEQLGQLNTWADEFALRMAAKMAEEVAAQIPSLIASVVTGVVSASASGYASLVKYAYNNVPQTTQGLGGYQISPPPTFANGGTVDAPEGQAVPAIVHGGEMILNREQQKALGIKSYAEGTLSREEHLGLLHKLSREQRRKYSKLMSQGADGASLDEYLKKASAGLSALPNEIGKVDKSKWGDWQFDWADTLKEGVDWMSEKIGIAKSRVTGKAEKIADKKAAKLSDAHTSVEESFDEVHKAIEATKSGAPGHGKTGRTSGSPLVSGRGGRGGGKPTGAMAGLQKEAQRYIQQVRSQQTYNALLGRFFWRRQIATGNMGGPMGRAMNMQGAMMDTARFLSGDPAMRQAQWSGKQAGSGGTYIDPNRASEGFKARFNAAWEQQQHSRSYRDMEAAKPFIPANAYGWGTANWGQREELGIKHSTDVASAGGARVSSKRAVMLAHKKTEEEMDRRALGRKQEEAMDRNGFKTSREAGVGQGAIDQKYIFHGPVTVGGLDPWQLQQGALY